MKTKFLLSCLLISFIVNVCIGSAAHAQAVNTTDSLALVDLYDSCNGPAWRINTNWLLGPVSTWYGVTITSNRVTGLNVNFNYLTGSLPVSFGNLTALTTFSCEDNHLTGSLPSSIGNLSSLTYLSMYDNQLTGSIPASIGNLSNLTYLQLGYNQLTDSLPSSLGNLTAMQTMSITYNQISGSLPPSLGNLTNMSILYLNDNQLTGEVPSSFSNLSSLRLTLLLHNHLSQSTNSYPVHGGYDYLNFNNFNFNGLETVAQQMPQTIYYPQLPIAVQQQNDSTLFISAGGTLSNNTYTWYLAGQPDITTVISGDSTFHPAQEGQYFAEVNNAIATQLMLETDTLGYNPPIDSATNNVALKFQATDTSATNINSAKDKNGNEYIVIKDLHSGKATVRRFTGTSWQTIGKSKFSFGAIFYPSIAVNGSGAPYVVYQDVSRNGEATVMMYNGSTWAPVGAPGISVGAASFTSITVSKTGTPVIAYQDAGLGNIAVVKSFNGSSWVSVGQGSFPVGVAYYTYITTGPDGKIYLACYDQNVGSKGRVVVFDGSTWKDVGNAGFSAGNTNLITLKFDNKKVPYVAYQDGYRGHGTMMKLQNNQWVLVGKRNAVGSGTAQYITFDFSAANEPYVAFQDLSDGAYLTVEKWSNNKWSLVGAKGFTGAQSEYTNMFFDKAALPSVVYTDYSRNLDATLTQFSNGKWTNAKNMTDEIIALTPVLKQTDQNTKIRLSPNPVNGLLTIRGLDGRGDTRIIIADVAGNVWLNTIARQQTMIKYDVSLLKPGSYVVSIQKDNTVSSLHFIKQ